MSEVKPALTPLEWAKREYVQKEHASDTGRRMNIFAALYEGYASEPEEGEVLLVGPAHGHDAGICPAEARHAVAALALHGQPFGFTREDVHHLRVLEHTGIWPISVNSGSLADRIEALLPPKVDEP